MTTPWISLTNLWKPDLDFIKEDELLCYRFHGAAAMQL